MATVCFPGANVRSRLPHIITDRASTVQILRAIDNSLSSGALIDESEDDSDKALSAILDGQVEKDKAALVYINLECRAVVNTVVDISGHRAVLVTFTGMLG